MKSTSKISVFIRFSVLVALLAPGIAQAATVKLTVTKAGTGAGTVVSAPAGINCGATCNFNFTTNTSVKLTATAAAGSKLSAWSGACTGTTTTCTVTVNVAKTVTATFVPIPIKLTVTKAGTGAGTVVSTPAGINCGATCNFNFTTNTSVKLTATAAAGSKLSAWSGACTGTTTTCTVTMNVAKTVTATFVLIPIKLTVTKAGTGTGTVTSTPAGINCGATCVANFNQNSVVTLSAVAAAGSKLTGWSGGCTGTATTCAVTMNAAKTVTATFAPIPVALTVTKAGTGSGTVTSSPAGINCGATCTDNFNQNSSVILTATPDAGSTFSGWSGACTGSTGTCTVNMTQAQTISANFALMQKTLTVSKTGAGTGTVVSSPIGIDCGVTCTADFNPNQTVKLTATTTIGSTFSGWSGACTGTASTCIVTMAQAQSVTAGFLPQTTTLTGTTYQYDANGNLIQVIDPLGQNRQIQYDHLDQPVRRLEPDPDVIGNTAGQIDTVYDGLGQITQIIDPRNLTTDYQVDHLGNVLSQTSPDTGVTQNTYDDAGNLLTRTDARGKTAAYRYDGQNRLTQAVYEDQSFIYTWDTCTNGIGRLCSLANGANSLALSYDLHGRVTGKAQTEGAVTLNINNSYTASGQIQQTILPSGHTISYIWQQDRLEAIDINGEPLISQIAYEPDGQIGSWTWSNSEYSERFYDLAGRPVAISLGLDGQNLWPTLRNYRYDAAGRITGISDDIDPELDQIFGYDGLDRLITSQKGALTLSTGDYTYDLSGNRTRKIINNSTTETHNIDPGSNRLQQKSGVQTVNYSYDPAGNLLTDGSLNYSYNAQGRRISATATNLNASYSYNALGQRVSKTVNGTTTRFVYDQQGHVLGEYNTTGQLIQEIVWLGDLPVAVLKPNAAQSTLMDVFYIHSDHLATPRKITRPSDNKVVWSWESEAFGNSLPNQNPNNLGSFVFNLRFPGQYYDQETGLHYNVFRDYDPDGGRYVESDPIGLAGGINTYAYVGGNPVNLVDPLGLKSPSKQNWWYHNPYAYDPYYWAQQATKACREFSEKVNKMFSEAPPELPALDSTGKVHGELPRPEDLDKYDKDDLENLKNELEQSVKERIRKTTEMGRDRNHGQRQGAEQDLIKSIEKHLSGS